MFKFKKKNIENKCSVTVNDTESKAKDDTNTPCRWRKNLKRGCAGLVCLSLLLLTSFENTRRIDNASAMTESDILIYDANGGTGGPKYQSVNGNAIISSTKPTRDGYDFLYWASTRTWANDAKTVTINNSTIDRAFFRAIGNNKYEIMVHTNGPNRSVEVPIWTAVAGQPDLAWHPLNPGSWKRDGQVYNWGAQVTCRRTCWNTTLGTYLCLPIRYQP